MKAPTIAMVLAAGLGTRMRPLTLERPKALIEVGGRSLIDRTLDRLVEAGVERAVVNVHAFADAVEAHLAGRRDLEIRFSNERAGLLETGGAVKAARPLLGDAPIFVLNCDYVWVEPPPGALALVGQAWDPARMDACLVVVAKARTRGFATPGDFIRAADGRLDHRAGAAEAPLHCFGIEIIDPRLVYEHPSSRFSLLEVWLDAAQRRRLYGVEPPGLWMQVGDPAALAVAEAELRFGAAAAAP